MHLALIEGAVVLQGVDMQRLAWGTEGVERVGHVTVFGQVVLDVTKLAESVF